jgi:hypothetical protein
MSTATAERTRARMRQMPFAEYAAIRAVNWSSLRNLAVSPLRYRHAATHPQADTPTMALGRLIHTATLEPELMSGYAVWTGGSRRTNAYREWAAEQGGREIVTAAEHEQALGAASAVWKHREARRLLRGGRTEVVLTWIDPETRVRCKARLDHLRGGVLTDLKSTADIDARAFGRTAERLGYHAKLSFYRLGMAALGLAPEPVYIIAVEQTPPHDVAVYEVDEDTLFVGGLEARALLAHLKQCRRRRRWPGRYPDVERLDFPAWALASDSDMTDLGIAFEVRGATA